MAPVQTQQAVLLTSNRGFLAATGDRGVSGMLGFCEESAEFSYYCLILLIAF